MSTKKFVITHIVNNVSFLTNERHYSDTFEHFNVPWKINCNRIDDQLGVYLLCMKSRAGAWSIKTTHNLKVISIKGKKLTKPTGYTFANNSEFAGYGITNCISVEELRNHYVVDDKVIIEAEVTIEEMTGVDGPEKLQKFDISAEKLSDVVLIAGGEKFYVLKQYLSMQSPVFHSMFFGNFVEANRAEIPLSDVDPQDFQPFLELLHMEPSLTDSNVEGVLTLTDMFDTKNGTRLCEQFLMNDSKHSLRTKLRIADRFKLDKLKKHCFDNMKTTPDVRAAMGTDLEELSHSIAIELLNKALSVGIRPAY